VRREAMNGSGAVDKMHGGLAAKKAAKRARR